MDIKNCRNFEKCQNVIENAEYEIRVVNQVNYSQVKPKWSKDRNMAVFSHVCPVCINKVQEKINEAISKLFD